MSTMGTGLLGQVCPSTVTPAAAPAPRSPAEAGSLGSQCSSRLKQLQARVVRVLAESPPSLVEPLVSILQLQDANQSLC
ncbi:hypothetical protein GH733_011020 [Mirounga leonina]|nr:hypothetical protein GH733_011020 [Mirounga leonina]